MPDLKFNQGDRVSRDGAVGSIVTVNHDDADHVIFLVKFDDPVGTIVLRGGQEIPERTVWVRDADLALVQSNIDWAKEQLLSLAAGEPSASTVERARYLRDCYDRWTGSDRDAESRRAFLAAAIADLGTPDA